MFSAFTQNTISEFLFKAKFANCPPLSWLVNPGTGDYTPFLAYVEGDSLYAILYYTLNLKFYGMLI